jgi:hypothetical protein
VIDNNYSSNNFGDTNQFDNTCTLPAFRVLSLLHLQRGSIERIACLNSEIPVQELLDRHCRKTIGTSYGDDYSQNHHRIPAINYDWSLVEAETYPAGSIVCDRNNISERWDHGEIIHTAPDKAMLLIRKLCL